MNLQEGNALRALSGASSPNDTDTGTWIQVGRDLDGEAGDTFGTVVAMSADGNRIAVVGGNSGAKVSEEGRVTKEGRVTVYELVSGFWSQLGSDITMEYEPFRNVARLSPAIDMSANGNRIAFSLIYSGYVREGTRVRVYELVAGAWIQIGSDLEQQNTGIFRQPIAMSADGNRVALLVPRFGYTFPPSGTSVRVYEFLQSGDDDGRGEWIRAGNDLHGYSGGSSHDQGFDMSSDRNRIAIGERIEYVEDIVDRAVVKRSTVAVYDFVSGDWSRRDTIHGYNGNDVQIDIWARSIAISPDGNRVALSTRFNTYNPNQRYSKVGVFALVDSGGWTQIGSDIDGENDKEELGLSMAMSADGNRIALGAPFTPHLHLGRTISGCVQVYDFTGDGEWIQVGSDIDGETVNDNSGWSVDMSSDGNQIIIGAPGNDENGFESGSVRVFAVAPVEPMVTSPPDSDPMPEPAWWPRIAATFNGTNLKKCRKRKDRPPSAGKRCQREAKTCFFGTQLCPNGVGPHPATRCFCDGIHGDRVWTCDEAECPALATDFIE